MAAADVRLTTTTYGMSKATRRQVDHSSTLTPTCRLGTSPDRPRAGRPAPSAFTFHHPAQRLSEPLAVAGRWPTTRAPSRSNPVGHPCRRGSPAPGRGPTPNRAQPQRRRDEGAEQRRGSPHACQWRRPWGRTWPRRVSRPPGSTSPGRPRRTACTSPHHLVHVRGGSPGSVRVVSVAARLLDIPPRHPSRRRCPGTVG